MQSPEPPNIVTRYIMILTINQHLTYHWTVDNAASWAVSIMGVAKHKVSLELLVTPLKYNILHAPPSLPLPSSSGRGTTPTNTLLCTATRSSSGKKGRAWAKARASFLNVARRIRPWQHTTGWLGIHSFVGPPIERSSNTVVQCVKDKQPIIVLKSVKLVTFKFILHG